MVIVVMLFGVGKLPEVFGAVGKGMREFRRNASDSLSSDSTTTAAPTQPVEPVKSQEVAAQPQDVAAH
jgi:sec-independent protein translocase protein TatA